MPTKNKLSLAVVLAMLLMLILPSVLFAEDQPKPIKVYIDGVQIEFAEQPFIEEGNTLVQFRPIFEKLDMIIVWDEATRTVKGINNKDGFMIQLTIESRVAKVKDNAIELEVAPIIVNGNTFVPLRFVAEATGKKVEWDGVNRIINIKSNIPHNAYVYEFKQQYFVGDLIDGKPNGTGKIYNFEGNLIYEGIVNGSSFVLGKGKFFQTSSNNYDGEWKDGKYHGQGTLNYNQETYVGEFKDGKYHGKGILIFNNEVKYEGDFVDGIKKGKGKMTFFKDGGTYEGEWENNQYNGFGIYTWTDGRKYEGRWFNSKKHGNGVFSTPSGYKYDGEWKEDKQTGFAVDYFNGGVSNMGFYVNGVYSETETVKYFKEKFNVTLLGKDVVYDMANSVGKNFLLIGNAELSNYFNYGYSDSEKTHFSVRIKPHSGVYKEEWYIYFQRDKYKDLFDILKKGEQIIILSATIPTHKYSKWQDNVAEVVEVVWK